MTVIDFGDWQGPEPGITGLIYQEIRIIYRRYEHREGWWAREDLNLRPMDSLNLLLSQ